MGRDREREKYLLEVCILYHMYSLLLESLLETICLWYHDVVELLTLQYYVLMEKSSANRTLERKQENIYAIVNSAQRTDSNPLTLSM
jgi:hypothetical protein